MTAELQRSKPGKAFWIGWVLTGLVGLFLIGASAVPKFLMPAPAREGFARLGWPEGHAPMLGVLEIACALVYLIPRTAVLGAILLTGYLGGAVATHVRIGDAWFAPVIVGVVVWLGLFLREPRLRPLVPLLEPLRNAQT